MKNDEVDLTIGHDGDFIIQDGENKSICEFVPSDKSDLVRQIVMNRVRTMKPDWFYDHVGADLEQLLGEDNTKATAEKGVALIKDAIIYDGFLEEQDVWINPSPLNNYTIVYMLAIRISEGEQLMFQVSIALSSGINIEEV